MAITLSTGTSISIASTYGTSKAFTTITNASEAVASFTADPSLAAGDLVEVTSGWGRLDKRVVRIKAVAGAGPYTATFESVDTSDTDNYPASGGAGSIREITAWTEITQIKGVSAGGGDQQYADITTIADVVARQMPTIRSAVTMDLEVFDDPTLGWYTTVTTASDTATAYGLKMSFPNGSKLYANSYFSLQKVPNVATNEALTSKVSLSYAADPIRYSA